MVKPRQSGIGLPSVGSQTRQVWSPLSYTLRSMLIPFSRQRGVLSLTFPLDS